MKKGEIDCYKFNEVFRNGFQIEISQSQCRAIFFFKNIEFITRTRANNEQKILNCMSTKAQ